MSDKNIPLSELIRIGCQASQQCRMWLCVKEATCAIGAAYLAKTGEFPENGHTSDVALERCGVNPNILTDHPVLGRKYSLVNVIISLNDTHKWSREKIADWLESINL